MRAVLALTLLLIACAGCFAGTMLERASRDVIVKWRTLPSSLDAADVLPAYASEISEVKPALRGVPRSEFGLDRIAVISLTTGDVVGDVVETLRRDPRVEYAEPRPIRHTHGRQANDPWRRDPLDGVPDDPYYDMQWGLQQIEAASAWNVTRGDPNTVIAVVDVGIWFGHPDLNGQGWQNDAELNGVPGVDDDHNGYTDDVFGYDFVDNDGDPTPDPLEAGESHGTHVAGIAAAIRNNARGGCGVAPECRVMAVRAGSNNSIPYGYEGIYYASRSGARVVNCSWGGDGESAYEHDILDYVAAQNCIVVASAGNSATSTPNFPAAIEGVVSVAATRLSDLAAGFTNYGPWVKVSAPGVAILSTMIMGTGVPAYGSWQGTSMAAPFVTGVIALVASRFPQLDNYAIIERVIGSSDPIDAVNPNHAEELGLGRVNAWRAVADSVVGLRLGQVTYTEASGSGDGRVRAGESANIHVSVYNDLAPVDNVYGRISTPGDTISVTSSTSLYGDLPVGGPFWNQDPPFTIEIPITVTNARILPLTIEWLDGIHRVVGRATTRVYLDSTFVAVNNGRMNLGFAENGSLGYSDYERNLYIGPGLRIEGRPTNALYHGSFVVAADGIVSDNLYGNADLTRFDWLAMPDSVAHFVASTRAEIEAHTTFEDTQAEQMLFARVSAAALAWTAPEANSFITLEYEVVNRSINPWTEAYLGFIMDWDLGASSRNLSHFDTLSQIAYVSQVATGHPLVGITPLSGVWHTYYVVNNRAEIDPPADWSDFRKWQILTGGINASPTEPMDLSHVVDIGPFTVPAHDSLTAAFAIVAGNDLIELRAAAEAARAHFALRKLPPSLPPAVKLAPGLYPNPLPAGSNLRLVLPQAAPATLRFYNLLGQLVAEVSTPLTPDGPFIIDRSALNGASGLLIYRVESAGTQFSGKLLLVK